jgi:uncharacterized protein YkwD
VVAVLAVGVASVVGTLTFGSAVTRSAVSGPETTPPAALPDAAGTPVAGTPAAAPAVGEALAPSDPASSPAPTTEAAATPTPSKAAQPPAPKPPGATTAEGAVLGLVNQERAKAGCLPLAADSRLATAARLHSQDMANAGYFDHTTPAGVTFDQRITGAGYKWSNAGENIAEGQPDAASVMRAWMNSPGHRANILNCKFKDIGIGLANDSRGAPLWTQDFGAQLR